jgi:AcrR family transcriptional regulator
VFTADDRVRQIKSGAERLFLELGYARTSMQSIASTANISKRTLYQIYPDKASVFLALLRDQDKDAVFAPIAQHQSAHDALASSLSQAAQFVFRPKQLALTRIAISEAAPELSVVLATHIDGSFRALLERMIEMADLGMLNHDAARRYADLMLGAVLGSWHLRALAGNDATSAQVALDERISDVIETFASRLQLDEGSPGPVHERGGGGPCRDVLI